MILHILFLNDMRHTHFDDLTPVAWADSLESLKKFVDGQRVPTYKDTPGRWTKTFKVGGPLEWYNPPYDEEQYYRPIPIYDARAAT